MTKNIGVHIFTRDLRINDNKPLYELSKQCDKIIGIFVFTTEQVINNDFKSERGRQPLVCPVAGVLRARQRQHSLTVVVGSGQFHLAGLIRCGARELLVAQPRRIKSV